MSVSKTDTLDYLVKEVAEQRLELTDLIDILEPLVREHAVLPSDMALQPSTALIDIERNSFIDDQLQRLVNDQHAPTLAVNDAGQILSLNTGATRLFATLSGDGLASLGVSREQFKAFRERLHDQPGSSLLQAYAFDGEEQKKPVLLVGSYQHRLRAFVFMALQHHWPETLNRALHEIFGLSNSECAVLAALSGGVNAEQIAQQRGSKTATVRQQIKAILAKLDLQTTTSAATLAAAAASVMSETAQQCDTLPNAVEDWPLNLGEFYRDGRRVGWRRFGDPRGRKVLMIHGPTFGAGEYVTDRRMAKQLGLDVLAIERPGYGRTDQPKRLDNALQCQVADAMALLQQQSFMPERLLAHEVGLITALALQAQLPKGHCGGIVGVSAAPPFLQQQQINSMPTHQGIFIQAARHAPWLARLLIRLLMVKTRQLGPKRWTDVVFDGVEPDHAIIQRPELRAGVIGTYSFNLNQSGAGFEVDLRVMLNDWMPLLQTCNVPLTLLHGDKNQTTTVAALAIFREANDGVDIELFPNEGLTLAVSQPTAIWQRINASLSADSGQA